MKVIIVISPSTLEVISNLKVLPATQAISQLLQRVLAFGLGIVLPFKLNKKEFVCLNFCFFFISNRDLSVAKADLPFSIKIGRNAYQLLQI